MSGLEGSQLFELRSRVLKVAIQIIRKQIKVAVFVHEPAANAAIVLIAHSVQASRVRNRKRSQKDRVHQREDGNVRSDAKRDGKDHSRSEAGRLAELAEGKFEVVHGSMDVRATEA